MAKHGNSLNNDKKHHLYAIHDRKEKDIFKYGISDKPIGEDGYSARMREQINYLNAAVGIIRYIGEVLIKGIIGRKKARQIEDQYIEAYEQQKGRKPRGNRKLFKIRPLRPQDQPTGNARVPRNTPIPKIKLL